MVVVIDRYRLVGVEEAGVGDNDNIGVIIGRGVGRESEQGLGWRVVISGSKQVKWGGMEWGGRVIHQYRQQAGNTVGGGRRSSKTLNLKRDRV